MATETTLLGLRAQITANMNAMDISTAEIVTIINNDKWQAIVIQDKNVLWQSSKPYETKEAAFEDLLELLSFEMYCQVADQLS